MLAVSGCQRPVLTLGHPVIERRVAVQQARYLALQLLNVALGYRQPLTLVLRGAPKQRVLAFVIQRSMILRNQPRSLDEAGSVRNHLPRFRASEVLTDLAIQHVLEGDGAPDFRGGHRFESAVVGKTVFPERWDDGDILSAIRVTIEFPLKIIERKQEIILLSVIDNVLIEVRLKKSAGGIQLQHAFPQSGDGVFRNEALGRRAVALDLSFLEQ